MQVIPPVFKHICIGFFCLGISDVSILEGIKGLNQMIVLKPNLLMQVSQTRANFNCEESHVLSRDGGQNERH